MIKISKTYIEEPDYPLQPWWDKPPKSKPLDKEDYEEPEADLPEEEKETEKR